MIVRLHHACGVIERVLPSVTIGGMNAELLVSGNETIAERGKNFRDLWETPEGIGIGSIEFVDEPVGLPEPPPELADAWARYQRGDDVAGYELSKLDEWRADCARDAGL